ncbi:MAG: hypothetical protein K1X94_17505, partial [Sandaracinaceae bacterium]|nr:hypothetical protein [Sandaracinaceae bacterium]
LVLAGVVPSSPSALETLRSFVEGGGGLLVAPSPAARSIDLAAIEELLRAHLGEVREVALAGEGPALVPGEGPAIVPPGPTGLEGLSVRSALTLEADAEQTSLRLADGAPFLVLDEEHRRAVLAVGLDDAMSDLPLRVGFVPLLASLAQRLARPGALPDHPFVAGEAPPLRVASDVSALEIVTPTGEVMSRELEHGAVTLDDLAEPGAYAVRVEQGGRVRELDRAALVIVPPADEIDLTPHVPDMRERPSAETQRGESRLPVERWIYVLVGLLAAIEGFARLGLVRVPTRTG